MLKILLRIYDLVQKLVKLLGITIIIRKVNSNTKIVHQVRLHQKNIKNLKIVLNRDNLLKLFPKNSIIAEIGVDKGDFSAKINFYTKPKKLYLIDIWDSERYNLNKMDYVKKRFQKEIDAGSVCIIRGTSEKELKNFNDGFFDWVYIDTTHTYFQTLKELEICRLKVKAGGIIAGHDYCQGNINRTQLYGVVQAVNQFCVKYDWEFIYLTHETDRALSFAIKEIK